MLRWSQEDLAGRAGVSKPTITDFEREARWPMPKNLQGLREALEAGGIEFIEANGAGQGVRFKDRDDEAKPPDEPSGE